MSSSIKTFQFGQHTVTLETGKVARQANASVMVSMGDTVVLVAVVASDSGEARDFFPLTVNYQERTYAAGSIPGGYFKREGRPTEKETLTCRLIDRPIRPLFPEGFCQDVQIVATVMSVNPDINPDIPAIIGASAALMLSGLPFQGPIAAARVGYKDGNFILNPNKEELAESALNLVVAGTSDAVLMVESEAEFLSESVMLDSVLFGHQQMQVAIDAISEWVGEAGKTRMDWQAPAVDATLQQQVVDSTESGIQEAYLMQDKMQRQARLKEILNQATTTLCNAEKADSPAEADVAKIFKKLEKRIVRGRILNNEPRIDGRDLKTVRPIKVETGILPRTHGSALFTRGETQAIVVATLGTGRDAQIIDALDGEYKDTFMLHYNFPPYCVGEVGFMGSPKRREIGHGRLARRGMQAVLPTQEEFPYVIRVVSEITESNGSSSMASVCGTSLALMDAGVPVSAPVAGIAMGLVKDADKFAVITDILGDEDHLGDMDFKVAGTVEGITALQMDIKIGGINKEIMEQALSQAKDARLHILDIMQKTIQEPRTEMSDYAPRIINMQINPEKIREVIGKGGSTIRGIIEETGVSIDINDEGLINIASVDGDAAQEAIKRIEAIIADVEIGTIYEGKVIKLVDFGAFVNILPGKDGLVHVSQIANERVEDVSAHLEEGQIVKVKVLDIDRQGRIRLSIKALLEEHS